MRAFISVLVLLVAGASESAAQPQHKGCLNFTGVRSQAAMSGILTLQLFPGPPNYESVAEGDAEERAFILELPRRMCANDGEFILPATLFDRVHISASDDAILSVLGAAVGRSVTVRGEAFGAHTGHHHAPLVLFAEQVTVVSKTH